MQPDDNLHLYEPEVEYEGASIMDKPFDPTRIKIETKTPSLDKLIKRISRNSIQLNTETYFQRKDDLWDETKQSRLIESILIRFPLPALFFDATDDNSWLIVDGLQRLSSLRNFVVNQSLRLSNLEFLSHLDGCSWSDLPENLQRLIEETQVVIYKIMPGTPTDVKFNIFKRINTGGLTLEAQEIRHALFQGKPASFVHELACSSEFKEATQYNISPQRMLDRDFVNRFLAFYLLGVENYGTKEYGLDLDSYMSNAMVALYSKSDAELDNIRHSFKTAMIRSKQIFGNEAFRKVTGNYVRLPRINKALFDAISTQFALLNEHESLKLLDSGNRLKDQLIRELSENSDFYMAVTSATGDKNRVELRHKTVKELINKVI